MESDKNLNNNWEGTNSKMTENNNSSKTKKGGRGIYIWLPLCIAVSVAVGIFIGNAYSIFGSGSGFLGRKGNKLDVVLDYINKSYVDTVNVDALIENAIPTVLAD